VPSSFPLFFFRPPPLAAFDSGPNLHFFPTGATDPAVGGVPRRPPVQISAAPIRSTAASSRRLPRYFPIDFF
jgi:hypothetical protein